MTCIVAVSKNGVVYMGADSAGVAGLSLQVRRDPKIYKVGDFIFGFTSSFRMGQLLGYEFTPPIHPPEMSVEMYMVKEFIAALRKTLSDGGYARTKDGEESAGEFLVGYRGRIFKICSDYQVGENQAPFDSTGCGSELALGALHALGMYSYIDLKPYDLLLTALETAEKFSAGVRRPFIFQMSAESAIEQEASE